MENPRLPALSTKYKIDFTPPPFSKHSFLAYLVFWTPISIPSRSNPLNLLNFL